MVRFGVIGTNWITDRFLESVKDLHDFELHAVFSRTTEKAEEFAEKYDINYTFTNYEEMAKSDVIDAVYIASPNSLHKEHAIVFLNNGKHVLCEKPLASNVSETKEMIKAATENNVLLMEAMRTTLHPNFKVIKENLYKLGTIRRYFASYCKYSSRYDAYKAGTILNAFNPNLSNGSLMDLGVYCIYPMVVLFGAPLSVKGTGVLLESGVDGGGSLIAQYEGMDAVIMHSKMNNSFLPSEIQGEEGSMIIHDNISSPDLVEIKYKDGSEETISMDRDQPEMYYEAEEFIKLIQEGKTMSSINSFENSLHTAEIMEDVRKQLGLIYTADLTK
ncbi:putative dehydrogenase [Bacillus mesophilus]|uniref:Gfo/Idh/MocA family oxidoreductase n=1 Tax=Bacillus mesophilus TaxID=1808955 RepID=A0A6M0Q8A6_9BACI|nr:Gfo/Idh/MocA family oxidoreductase [Bacillus mesophilus]MBM7662053.1 putative dehydrogenase [Bacillus mesophilus]NEY72592.1 Gfo/Idh/MocA family oxidoreductase [Bacillus mesophilus]